MQTYPLIAHAAHPPLEASEVRASVIGRDDHWLRLRWRIEHSAKVVFPPFAGKGRADELWRTTCFEAFFRPLGSDAYVELNLSPSERWAAYDFAAYREGMAERAFPHEPVCTIRAGQNFAIFDTAIPLAGLPEGPCDLGLSAVIEEEGGHMSYWALAHPHEKPDFHDPACFAAHLAPPEAA